MCGWNSVLSLNRNAVTEVTWYIHRRATRRSFNTATLKRKVNTISIYRNISTEKNDRHYVTHTALLIMRLDVLCSKIIFVILIAGHLVKRLPGTKFSLGFQALWKHEKRKLSSSGMYSRVDNVGYEPTLLRIHHLALWFLSQPIFYLENGGDTFLRNFCSNTDYMALCPRIWQLL
jgi:hypothetical protein